MFENEPRHPLDRQLKSILVLANALKLINQSLKDGDFGSAMILEYNVIEHCVYKLLVCVPEVKQLRFMKEPDRFGLFKEIETIINAINHNHVLFQECSVELMNDIRDWVIERNKLTHELMNDDRLQTFNETISRLAIKGKMLVMKLIRALRLIRSRSRNLSHIRYVHQPKLFTSIMLRFERQALLNQ